MGTNNEAGTVFFPPVGPRPRRSPFELRAREIHVAAGKDGFGCLFECQIFGYFSSIMDK